MGKKLREAENDDTPIVVNSDSQNLVVLGNANMTQVKRNTYEIRFRVEKELFDGAGLQPPEGAKASGNNYYFITKYEDMTIHPRDEMTLIEHVFKLLPFYNRINNDGSAEKMSSADIITEVNKLDEKGEYTFLHHIYNFVATFFRIDETMTKYMLYSSVLTAFREIIDNHPELLNESEVFSE